MGIKKLLILLVIASVLTTIAACSPVVSPTPTPTESQTSPTPGDETAGPTFDLTPESKKIKVSWFVPWWEKPELHQYVFDEFSRKYPEYEVDHSVYSGDIQQLAASIQAGTQADVWFGGDPNWAQYVTATYQGLLTPLDEYLENDPDYNFDTIGKSAMDSCRFVDGSYYAVPYEIGTNVLIRNKDVFARAGLDPEKPPETWTDFYEYARQLVRTSSDGVPTQLGFNGALPSWVMKALRKEYDLNEYGTESRINEMWVREVDQYCSKFETIYGGADKLPSGTNFSLINGNVGMEIGNLTQLNQYSKEDINFGFGPLPRPDDYEEHVLPAFLWMYIGIPHGSENPKGGWLFLKYAVTDAMILKCEKEFQSNPSRYFPSYIAHKPTRDKVYNLFLPNVDADVQAMINKRDEMINSINYYRPETPLKMRLSDLDMKWWNKFQKGEVNEHERFEGLHTEFQAELDQWKKDMINKGWEFPEDGAPVPPWSK